MKRALLLSLIIATLTSTAWADKILISGKAIILIPVGSYYSFPKDALLGHLSNHVIVAGEDRVCFVAAKPELANLDLLRITIERDAQKILWYCYRHDPAYFEADF